MEQNGDSHNPRYDLGCPQKIAVRAIALDLAGKLLMGIAIGLGIVIGMAIAG